MATKTETINSLRNAGYTEMADSTLRRKSAAELETLLVAVLDAKQAANDGKVEDLDNRETDCGGCENGECDNCGAYECCAEVPEEELIEDYNTTGDLVSWMLNLAEAGKSPREVGADLAQQAKSDGQSKIMKDREDLTPALTLVRETMKVVTAAGYQKDPENMKAALQALAQIAAKAADRI